MRGIWRFLLVGAALLSAGCTHATVPTASAPPATALAPTAAAPAPTPAAPAEPRLDGLRQPPTIGLTARHPARVYTGRGTYFLLIEEVGSGVPLPYLDSREGWFLVRTTGGSSGWIAAADVTVADSRGAAVAYTVAQGRWEMAAGDWQLKVTRPAQGVARVSLSGLPWPYRIAQTKAGAVAILPDGPLPSPAAHPPTAALPVGPPSAPTAALPVGDAGVVTVSIGADGVLVDTDGAPVMSVLSQSPGAVELEFRPGLTALEPIPTGWRLTLRGDARPVLRPEGAGLVLDLPVAAADPHLKLPDGVTIETIAPEGGADPALLATGVAVPTRLPAGGLRLHFPARPGPYALYRPAPAHVELRFLTQGLAGKTVMLDPGHGGEEPGTDGVGPELEKDVNLDVALRLKPLLEQAGARVLMTRSTDARVLPPDQARGLLTVSERTRKDLEYRADTANRAGVDLYLSIHNNAGPAAERGTETYWALPNLNANLSRRLAGLVQAEVLRALSLPDRGVKQRPFYVIRYTDAPAVLVELGFLTNAADERLLATDAGRQAAATALKQAVTRFFAEPD